MVISDPPPKVVELIKTQVKLGFVETNPKRDGTPTDEKERTSR